jgi:HPt (histidine-containing phosphotransfer) domain-containing protein
MEPDKPLVDRELVVELLYGDEEYVKEFAEASIESFSEFKENFKRYVRARDMENLRKTGHKIKPVAQIMKLDEMLSMYEESKTLLEEEASDQEINNLVDKMNKYCNTLLKELKDLK